MIWVSIVLGFLTLLGVVGTFHFGMKARSLHREIRRFHWEDIEQGAPQLLKRTLKNFRADAVITMSGPGAIVANLAVRGLGRELPVLTIQARHPKSPDFNIDLGDVVEVKTSRWIYYVPEFFLRYVDQRLIIMDDCTVTGDTLRQIVKIFVDRGFDRKNIRTCVLVTTQLALDANQAPDMYGYLVSDSNFYMPWGRSLGWGYDESHTV